MSKSIAYKTTLVQVIVREVYHHDYTRHGEQNALDGAEDEYLNPIKDSDIIYRETIHNWNDLAYKEVTSVEDLGVDDDGEN
tara:strand:- start:2563 stop:2805 length:243 start_codon:yes stop_codon:yes gene_type:complete